MKRGFPVACCPLGGTQKSDGGWPRVPHPCGLIGSGDGDRVHGRVASFIATDVRGHGTGPSLQHTFRLQGFLQEGDRHQPRPRPGRETDFQVGVGLRHLVGRLFRVTQVNIAGARM